MTAERPPWLALDEFDRRFTVVEVRDLAARLPTPRTRVRHEVAAPRPAATLVPVVDVDGEAAVILTRRPATMRYHRSDWVFPGGRVDSEHGETARDAAQREVEEELGIAASRVDVVGKLDTQGPIVTGFVIEVFVGVIEGPLHLAPDPREVAAVTTLRLSTCMTGTTYSDARRAPEHDPGPAAAGPPVAAPISSTRLRSFALPGGDLVWGTQGDILYNLLEQLVEQRRRPDRRRGVQMRPW